MFMIATANLKKVSKLSSAEIVNSLNFKIKTSSSCSFNNRRGIAKCISTPCISHGYAIRNFLIAVYGVLTARRR